MQESHPALIFVETLLAEQIMKPNLSWILNQSKYSKISVAEVKFSAVCVNLLVTTNKNKNISN